MNPQTYPHAGTNGPACLVAALGFTLVLVLMAATGCVPEPAIRQAQDGVTFNRAWAEREDLPEEAKQIAQDNADKWEVQRYLLGGPEPSPEVLERLPLEEVR